MNRIKEVLREQGRSQSWLAEKLGKSFNMVNGYCQNRRQPTIPTLFMISNILKVRVSELIDDGKQN